MTPVQKAGFKVGDKFRVLKSVCGFTEGQIVTLNRDDGSSAPMFKGANDHYRLADGHTSQGAYFGLDKVKKVIEFKVGDKVRILRGSIASNTSFFSSNVGKVGVITGLDIGTNLDLLVAFDSSSDWGRSSDVELVEEPPVVEKPDFKEGDRVIIVATGNGFERSSLNKLGNIRIIDSTSLPVLVEFDDGDTDWGTFEELRKVDVGTLVEQKLAQIETLVKEVRELVD